MLQLLLLPGPGYGGAGRRMTLQLPAVGALGHLSHGDAFRGKRNLGRNSCCLWRTVRRRLYSMMEHHSSVPLVLDNIHPATPTIVASTVSLSSAMLVDIVLTV